MQLVKVNSNYLIRILLYFALSFLISAISYTTNLLYFQTNDDFTQMLITSGILYETPSSQLLYLAKPLSFLIANFYLLSLNYSWYTILLLTSQSLAVFAYLLLIDEVFIIKNIKTRILALFVLISPVIIFLIFFFALQYTQTAMMLAGIGALLLLFGKNIYYQILASGLIILGIFWRAEAGLLAITLVISYFLLNILLNKDFSFKAFRLKRLLVIFFSASFAYAVFLAGFHENSPFISNEKQFAISYYKSLGKVLDYSPTETTREILAEKSKKVGWSKNDFRLLNNKFYFANQDLYTIDRNIKLTDLTAPESRVNFYREVSSNLNNILIDNHKRSIVFVIFFMILIFLMFRITKLFHIFAYLVLLYLVLVYVLSLGRLPERVIWPIVFVSLISLGTILFHNFLKNDQKDSLFKIIKYLTPLMVALFYILVALNGYDQYLKIDKELWWKYAKQEKIYGFDRVLNYKPDKPIIAFSSFYSALMKTHSPAKPPSQTEEIWRNMILIGWTIRSPEVNKKLAELEISQDLFTSVANQDAYLATSDHLVEIDYLNRYFRQHKYIKVNWAIAPFVYNDTGLGIWQIDSFEPLDLPE